MTAGERSRLNSPISARQRVEKALKAREGNREAAPSSPVTRYATGKAERVTIDRASEILGTSPRTIQKMAQRGEITGAAKIGRLWTFNEDRLRSFVRQKERETWRAQKH